MIQYFVLLLSFWHPIFFLSNPTYDDLIYKDHIYVNFIKSVKLHHRGLITSLPIVDLNSTGVLILSFDDLEGGDKKYIYEITHCDRNWQPSDLAITEYIDGFNGEEIENKSYSRGTFQNYTHYELNLPNRDLRWTKSGNYILAVYEYEYDKVLVFTRRFMVVEPGVTILGEVISPMNVSKIKSHQEIKFSIDYEDFRINNPLNEVEVSILQNGRWDNGLRGIKPKYIRGNLMEFQYVDQLNFPALKEFRYADIRSAKFLNEGIHSIDINTSGIDVLLQIDQNRTFKNYHDYNDLNGSFIIETFDDNNDQIEAEYVNVIFTLEVPGGIEDSEVYIFGQFTDWELHEDFKMRYDALRQIFIAEFTLKQGYYDYYYVVVKDGIASEEALEGSWYETENNYTLLIYLSEFGARYDRLIGTANFSSID